MITVRVRTVALADPRTETARFYRTYQGPDWTVLQWGPSRGGREGGTFKLLHSPERAVSHISQRRSDGWALVGDYKIQLHEAPLQYITGLPIDAASQQLGSLLDHVRHSYKAGWVDTARRANEGRVELHEATDVIGRLCERLEAAIAVVAQRPSLGVTRVAEIADEIDRVGEAFRKMSSLYETLRMLTVETVLNQGAKQ